MQTSETSLKHILFIARKQIRVCAELHQSNDAIILFFLMFNLFSLRKKVHYSLL